MGQQQLLLVILVTIIVGIATVVALNVFGTQADEANRDAGRQDILGAAANAQGYYIRPDMMEGGGYDFDGLTMDDLSIPGTNDDDDSQWWNENGSYTLSNEGGNTFTLTGHPASAGGGTDEHTEVGADDQIEATITVEEEDGDEEVSIEWGDGS